MAKKKTTSKKSSSGGSASKKKTAKKSTSRKPAAKKPTRKKTTKKTTAKKSASKKSTAKKTATKKKTTKKSTKKKSTTKKSTTQKTSTKKTSRKKTTAKKAPASAPAKPAEPTLEDLMEKDWTVAQLKRVKTGLTKSDLKYYLQLLLEKRAEIIGNVQGMEDARSAALGDIAHMPLHMADVGSDNYEQEFTLGLMESERQMLREIEEALVRMRDGYYGVCLDSGQPINRASLEIKPWAKYCIEVARLREKRGW